MTVSFLNWGVMFGDRLIFFAQPLQRSNLCASHRQRRWLTYLSYAVGHGLASSDCGPELVRVGGQDCDGPWVQQPLLGHGHPVSWLPYELPAGDDRQISSQDRRSVKLRVRPPPAGTHQCHRATSQAAE